MNLSPEDKEYFSELILKAVQSGKKETSGLIADIKKRLEESDRIIRKADQERHSLHDKIDNMVINNESKWVEQNKRWADAKPVLDMGKNIAGFSIVIKIILGVFAALGSIWLGFGWLSTHLINKIQ